MTPYQWAKPNLRIQQSLAHITNWRMRYGVNTDGLVLRKRSNLTKIEPISAKSNSWLIDRLEARRHSIEIDFPASVISNRSTTAVMRSTNINTAWHSFAVAVWNVLLGWKYELQLWQRMGFYLRVLVTQYLQQNTVALIPVCILMVLHDVHAI